MRTYQPYIVKQGDYLAKLAHQYDFDMFEVWNHPLNAELKAKRGSMDILYPGDVLFIPFAELPGLPIVPQSTNRYRAVLPTIELKLLFEDREGPLANSSCEVNGLWAGGEKAASFVTDAAGMLTLPMSPLVRELEVFFPDRGTVFNLRVGDMDPIDEAAGVNKRLANLGYVSALLACGAGGPEQICADGLAAFQRGHGLPASGKLDEATKDKLMEAYGC